MLQNFCQKSWDLRRPLAITLVLVAFENIVRWYWSWPSDSLTNRLIVEPLAIFAIAVALRTEWRVQGVQSSSNLLADHTKELDDAIQELKDATRRTLHGFAEIFDKMLWLLEKATEEVTYVNFVVSFADAHSLNKPLAAQFNAIQNAHGKSLDFRNAPVAFFDTFYKKCCDRQIERLKIVTLSDRAVGEEFVIPLSHRATYEYLDAQMIQTILDNEKKIE